MYALCKAIVGANGQLLEGHGNRGPSCINMPLVKETFLPRKLEAGERGVIIARSQNDGDSVWGFGRPGPLHEVIVEFLPAEEAQTAEDEPAVPIATDDRRWP